MPKFRKKPVVIEAFQWWPGEKIDGVEVEPPTAVPSRIQGEIAFIIPERAFIQTLEGWMEVSKGDWIITGVHGEKYPCKPDIFEKTYEPVADK